MKKFLSLFLALMMVSCCNILSSCNSNETTAPTVSTGPRKVALTKQNFDEYFTYEVTGHAYPTDRLYIYYDGEITLTFYPLNNIEVENCTVTIAIKDTPSKGGINVYQRVNGETEDKITRTVRVPYDGKFSVTFSNTVHFETRTYNATKNNIQVDIESITGTIIIN